VLTTDLDFRAMLANGQPRTRGTANYVCAWKDAESKTWEFGSYGRRHPESKTTEADVLGLRGFS
jgi:hypothetical protein